MRNTFFKKNEFKLDNLTQVYPREAIVQYAEYLTQNQIPFSLVLIDVDNFKHVNDNYGHSIGDKVIKLFSEKIKIAYGDKGVLGRFGGDEFIVVVENITEYDSIWTLQRSVSKQLNGFEADFLPNFFITCTMGLARYSIDGLSYPELIEKADKALYRGKTKGRSCFIIYLDSKHKDIQLHSSEDMNASSMQKHTELFRIFNKKAPLKNRIESILEYFSVKLMIDHIGIQGKDKILFSKVHSLSANKDFAFVENNMYFRNIESGSSIFFCNDINHLKNLNQLDLFADLQKQKVHSFMTVLIAYDEDNVYGILRADSSPTKRIWQYGDMDLLITGANIIATALYYENKKLEDLK